MYEFSMVITHHHLAQIEAMDQVCSIFTWAWLRLPALLLSERAATIMCS